MRRDMSKVIVEKPRYKGRGRLKTRSINKINKEIFAEDDSFDGSPTLEGSSVRESLKAGSPRSKYFSDHLAPLRRFMASRVGQKWDKVYSEMSAGLRGRSTTLDHLRGHIFDLVAINVIYDENGKPVEAITKRGWRMSLFDGYLYVDKAGFLRKVKGRPRRVWRKKQPPKNTPSSVLQRLADEISRALAEVKRLEDGQPPLSRLDEYPKAYKTIKGRLWRVVGDARVRATKLDAEANLRLFNGLPKKEVGRHFHDSENRFWKFIEAERISLEHVATKEPFVEVILEKRREAEKKALQKHQVV